MRPDEFFELSFRYVLFFFLIFIFIYETPTDYSCTSIPFGRLDCFKMDKVNVI